MATPKSPKAITIPQLIEDLKAAFPGTEEFPKMPIVESVLLAILRENHDLQEALRVLARFRSDFVDYNELRVSEIKEYQTIIGPVADSEARARSIRRFLREIFKHHYKFDIDGIAKKTFKEAKDDLKHYEALKHDHHLAHVQVQTLGGHAFPVDQRILVMAKRLGIVDQNADAATLRGILEKNIPKAQILQSIALVERFVTTVCTLAEPKCPTCRFNSFCPGYQLILNPPKPPAEKKPAKAVASSTSKAKSVAAGKAASATTKPKAAIKSELAQAVKVNPTSEPAPTTEPAKSAANPKQAAKPEAKTAEKSSTAKPAPKVGANPAKVDEKAAAAKPALKAAAKPPVKSAAKAPPKAEAKTPKPAAKSKKPAPKKSK